MKRLTTLLLFLAIICHVHADTQSRKSKLTVEDVLELIKPWEIKRYLSYLASDDLRGRNAGYPGNEKAVEYIKKHFKKLRLKPVKKWGYTQGFIVKTRIGSFKAKNVLAYYKGKHSKLKKEFIVVGAHIDHIGMDGQRNPGRMGKSTDTDKIWNGADDNASGTAAMMEIARVFAKSKIKTKRSILFIGFNAEEYGLCGALAYLGKPAYKLEKHIALINLDMIGRNPDKPLSVSGVATGSTFEKILKEASEYTGAKVNLVPKVSGGSDHASFCFYHIPSLFFTTNLHADYHKITDHWDKIDYNRMVKITKFAFYVIYKLANEEEIPLWKTPEGLPGFGRPHLGILFEEMGQEELKTIRKFTRGGALKVTGFRKKSIAKEAGMQKGDIIIKFEARKFPRKRAGARLAEQVRKAKINTQYVISIIRGGKKKAIKIKFKEGRR